MAASVASPFNELDVMLSDLSKGHYAASNSNDYSAYSDFGSFTKGTTPPNRPPPPREYKATVSVRSAESSSSKNLRRPPKPPKLQHVLTSGSRTHDLVKATPRYVKLRKIEHFWEQRGRFCKSKKEFVLLSISRILLSIYPSVFWGAVCDPYHHCQRCTVFENCIKSLILRAKATFKYLNFCAKNRKLGILGFLVKTNIWMRLF